MIRHWIEIALFAYNTIGAAEPRARQKHSVMADELGARAGIGDPAAPPVTVNYRFGWIGGGCRRQNRRRLGAETR